MGSHVCGDEERVGLPATYFQGFQGVDLVKVPHGLGGAHVLKLSYC